MKQSFETVNVKHKSTDAPWINSHIRKAIKIRKSIFKKSGRNGAWHRMKRNTDALISKAKKKYMLKETEKITTPNPNLSLIHI